MIAFYDFAATQEPTLLDLSLRLAWTPIVARNTFPVFESPAARDNDRHRFSHSRSTRASSTSRGRNPAERWGTIASTMWAAAKRPPIKPHRRTRRERGNRCGPAVVAVVVALVTSCTSSPTPAELVTTATEPPGANCPNGGTAIETGHDLDGNGALDPSEVQHTTYVCTPSPGPTQLVAIKPEPAGPNCANGGQVIEIGTDTNGNGVLDSSEVQQTSYVCQPGASPGQLVALVLEPPGPNCAYGGEGIEMGLDVNGDHILEQNEVQTTTYLCASQVQPLPQYVDGNVVVHNSVELAQLVDLVTLTGDLEIDAMQMSEPITVPMLQSAGSVHTNANTDVSFSSLQSVGTVFDLKGNTAHLSLPNLAAARVILETPVIDPVLPALSSGSFASGSVVGTVSLDSFATGDIAIGSVDNSQLSSVSLPAFTSGSLQLIGPISSVSVPVLRTASGFSDGVGIEVLGTRLTSLSLPQLTSSGIVLTGNTMLTTVSVPKLASGPLTITGNALSTLSFPSLTSSTTIDMESNAQLTSIDLPVLQSATSIQLFSNQLLNTVSAADLTSLSTLIASQNPNLPTCQLQRIATQSGATNVSISNQGNNDAATCP